MDYIITDVIPEENRIIQSVIDNLPKPRFVSVGDDIPKPELVTPIKYSYSVTNSDMERFDRKKKRAEEIGINLFILDEENIPEELKELEYFIMDNYLDLDKDIPEDIKNKYQELKKQMNE